MDVRREQGYWSHEEARWIIRPQVDVVAAAGDEPAAGTREGGDRPGGTVVSAGQTPDGPDIERPRH